MCDYVCTVILLFAGLIQYRKLLRLSRRAEETLTKSFIEPPEATILTDEDSADVDNGGLIDNLTGRQLRAGAQVVFADRSTVDVVASDDNNEDDEPHSIDDEPSDEDLADRSPTPPPSHARKHRRVGETRNSSATGSEQKCSKQQNVKREETRKHQNAASMWTQVDFTSSEALFPEADILH